MKSKSKQLQKMNESVILLFPLLRRCHMIFRGTVARLSLLALTGFADPLYNIIFYRNDLHITATMDLTTRSLFIKKLF